MARTRDRVTGVVIRNGKLLLIHRFRDGSEYWVFPGGGVEDGEDFDVALKREMMEEIGLEVVSYLKLFDQQENDGGRCIFYSCELEPGSPHLGGPELEEQSPHNQYHLEWVDLKQLPALLAVYPRTDKLIELLDKGSG